MREEMFIAECKLFSTPRLSWVAQCQCWLILQTLCDETLLMNYILLHCFETNRLVIASDAMNCIVSG